MGWLYGGGRARALRRDRSDPSPAASFEAHSMDRETAQQPVPRSLSPLPPPLRARSFALTQRRVALHQGGYPKHEWEVVLQECGWTIHSGTDEIKEGQAYACCIVAGPAMNDAQRVDALRVVYFLPDDRLGVEEVTHQFRSDGPWSDELSFTAETVEEVLQVRTIHSSRAHSSGLSDFLLTRRCARVWRTSSTSTKASSSTKRV